MTTFDQKLKVGQVGESVIAQILRDRKWYVLPVYEKQTGNYKGPRLFTPDTTLIAPDAFIIRGEESAWIECKRKARFSWHGISKAFVTGIDYRHYQDYLKIQQQTGRAVYLFFLHEHSDTWPPDVEKWKAPPECPTGLFCCNVDTPYNHKDTDKDGAEMVYWQYSALKQMATIEELKPFLSDGLFDF